METARAEFNQHVPALMLPKGKATISDIDEFKDDYEDEELNISELGVNEHKFMKRDV